MSTIVRGLVDKEKSNPISNSFVFIDSNENVFIVGDEDTIINISSSTFIQFKGEDYESIEEFLRIVFGTQLVKVLKNLSQFDIEIIVK